jgi:sec-independent protein translocase protein TatC
MKKQARTDQGEMTILDHLDELRQRLIKVVIAVLIGVIAGTFVTPPVLKLLVAPLGDQVPIAISPTEAPAVFFKS